MFHLHELEFYIRSPKYSVDQRALHTTVIYELKYPIQGVGRVSPSAHASDKWVHSMCYISSTYIVLSTFMYKIFSWCWRKYTLFGCACSKKGSYVKYPGFFPNKLLLCY